MNITDKTLYKNSLSVAIAILLSSSVLSACSGGKSDPSPTGVPTVGVGGANTAGGTTDGDTTSGGNTSGDTTAGDTTAGVEPVQIVDPTPIVRAPADETAFVAEPINLAGSVSFTGIPQDVPVITWTKISGPGNVAFVDDTKYNTDVSFDEAGAYVLQLEATNGEFSASDQVDVTVNDVVVNQSPIVAVGEDELIKLDEIVNLSAVVSDDGLPNNTLSGEWSVLSAPDNADATFGELSSESTTVSFSAVGDYLIQFSVSDGELSAQDKLHVEVEDVFTPEPSNPDDNINADNTWETVITADGSLSQPRHESAAVTFRDDFFAMGGRKIKRVDRYDSETNTWEDLGDPGFEMNHVQPVVYANKFYVLGALYGEYPSEMIIPRIRIFDPETAQWTIGAELPLNRQRGSGGVVVHNAKIYMVAGTTNGHSGGMVNWFDEYDPVKDEWKTLPPAPTARDHFSAVMIGEKLVVVGGRQSTQPNPFTNLVASVEIYDFETGSWSTGADIPTMRAGAMTVAYGDEVIIMGGESDFGSQALAEVEAYNVKTNTWRTLDPLQVARHSGGAGIIDGAIHVIGGNITTGGGNETSAHEKFELR